MDIKEIETFVLIVRTGSFQKAAELLQYAQPTISARIKQLELDLAISLFYRGKQVTLTPEGQAFYKKAEEFLLHYQSLSAFGNQLVQKPLQKLTLSISDPTASLVLPEILTVFKQKFPLVTLSIQVMDANACNQALQEGLIDFAICGEPTLLSDQLFEPFFYDELNLLVYDTHPLAQEPYVSLAQLKNETFLMTPENCPIRIKIEQYLKQALGTDYQKIEVTTSLAHKYYVQKKIGISIFTSIAHSERLPHTVVLPIDALPIRPAIGFLSSTKTKHEQELIDYFKECVLDWFQQKGMIYLPIN